MEGSTGAPSKKVKTSQNTDTKASVGGRKGSASQQALNTNEYIDKPTAPYYGDLYFDDSFFLPVDELGYEVLDTLVSYSNEFDVNKKASNSSSRKRKRDSTNRMESRLSQQALNLNDSMYVEEAVPSLYVDHDADRGKNFCQMYRCD
mmetsp:Transcript_11824/g.14357  ORF Transcript_11824/g.14357 Transcript_11824/m.14357 type:complete len:147 (+) Transcript_11824:258-698(+)